MTNSLTLF